MFELPEYLTLAAQMNKTIKGKIVKCGTQGNSPHKFVWYNRSYAEFADMTKGQAIGKASVKGRWLFIALEPGYVLVFGECGGRIEFHPTLGFVPSKYHFWLLFEDGSSLTAMTQMWGAMELYEKGKERERNYIKDMRTTPVEPGFTANYLSSLIDEVSAIEKKSAKGLLTQDQLIPGLGNAIAQDILFRAHLHPRHPIQDLSKDQRRQLHAAIVKTVSLVAEKGGRNDEYDLCGNLGKYVRLMSKSSIKQPCPGCDGRVEKIQYLGGACYFCPNCQK